MKKGLVLGLAIAGGFCLWFFYLQDQTADAIAWVRMHGVWGAVIAGLAYAAATVLMIPGSVATLAMGALYGPWYGLLVVSPASVLGATIAFLLGRGAFRPAIEKKMQGSQKFEKLQAAIANQGLKILTLVRLSPVFPFTLINYAFGLTRISLFHYVLGSFVGMLPGTLLYVYLGSAAEDISSLSKPGVDSTSTPIEDLMFYLGLAATAVVTVVITKIARQALSESDVKLNDDPRK